MFSRMFGNAARVFKFPKSGRAPSGSFKPQTLLFPKDRYSFMEAIQWARKHGYSTKKVRTEGRYIRIRQYDPAVCVKGTFRMVDFGKGIRAVFCQIRGAGVVRRAA